MRKLEIQEILMRTFIATLALVVMFAASCSSGFDREATIEEMMTDGLTEGQATCLVDSLVDEFGEETVMSDEALGAVDQELVLGITVNCFNNG